MVKNFSVHRRGPGHWDIYVNSKRWFRIRGGPSSYVAINETIIPNKTTEFKTISACMLYITDILMFEVILVENQDFETIKEYNI